MGKVCKVVSSTKFDIGGKRCVHIVSVLRENKRHHLKTYFQEVEEAMMAQHWDAAILVLPSDQDAISGKVAIGYWVASRGIKVKMKYTRNCLVLERV
jgi:hypothetical protein